MKPVSEQKPPVGSVRWLATPSQTTIAQEPVSTYSMPAAASSADTIDMARITEPTERQDHAFGIEKGFWKIQHGAKELLRLTSIYQQHRDTTAAHDELSRSATLPKEIDMLSMIQLSWGILHAVGEINNHNQRLIACDDASWRRDHLRRDSSPPPRSNLKLKRKRMADELGGCGQCGVTDSPRWRQGPAGSVSLCNVCGLLYAKKVRRLAELESP